MQITISILLLFVISIQAGSWFSSSLIDDTQDIEDVMERRQNWQMHLLPEISEVNDDEIEPASPLNASNPPDAFSHWQRLCQRCKSVSLLSPPTPSHLYGQQQWRMMLWRLKLRVRRLQRRFALTDAMLPDAERMLDQISIILRRVVAGICALGLTVMFLLYLQQMQARHPSSLSGHRAFRIHRH